MYDLCKYGNVHMLQHYLMTLAVPGQTLYLLNDEYDLVSHLPMAIDTGNEHFVRLLLQHINMDNIERANFPLTEVKFNRPGISVAMLKVLNEEFGCLFHIIRLWQAALIHSTSCNMVQSVQYMLDNMGVGMSMQLYDDDEKDVIVICLLHCAKDGNVNMFHMLVQSNIGAKYLDNLWLINIGHIVEEALDHGHEAFIKYLHQHYHGKGKIKPKVEQQILNCFESPEDIPASRLRVTPMRAILSNDHASLRSLISQNNRTAVCLDEDVCLAMSKPVATLLGGHSEWSFTGKSLLNMIKAAARPGSCNITVDLVCQYIDKWNGVDLPYYCITEAAKYSARIMQHILARFHHSLDIHCLENALKMNCRETMEYFFNNIGEIGLKNYHVESAAIKFVSKASLDNVIFMLDRMDMVKRDFKICTQAIKNPRLKVFEYSFNLFTMEQVQHMPHGNALDKLVHEAYVKDRPDIVQCIHQRIMGQVPMMGPIVPTLTHLLMMAENNAYHSLEYHFNSSTFNNMSITHRLRTLHSIIQYRHIGGATRVIKLCIDHIKPITQLNEHQINHKRFEESFHSNNNNIEVVVDYDQEVKLIEDHCLIDYLKAGATDLFLKAYSKSSFVNKHYPNTTLLDLALFKCDTRAVDVLLANPNMSIDHRHANMEKIFASPSLYDDDDMCSHPAWELMFDHLIMMMNQGAPIKLTRDILSLVQHPPLLRKLIKCHSSTTSNLKGLLDDNIINIHHMTDRWLTKPWALEMLQELQKHEILSDNILAQLLLMAIE
ncbi:hypothetical protein SAMD00019534_101400 [Acytostelium subglobosum LB1]|uniref:hypothetical protein n=1 Tax=Acytostelium subglobosum LB1 TaxID=1410327 RepID=UPI000644A6F7|nr:hypothetical protein SAMD00019534_101400 [Acytostelium subglobosum LB1]GAM26965.1 hypothetical protein SAMD00019534_101400 [Acytostelium subglobosum LB1]|eukprot:XP_012750233.1 hypothetical protein SAMD00019534_101400 [Acytostelium subglobosum LB1]